MRTYKVTIVQIGKPSISLNVIARHVVDAILATRDRFPANCSVIARVA